MNAKGVLIIFAKAPVAGQVKTRLIPDVGRHRATDLYKEFLTITIDTALAVEFLEIQILVSGNINHPYFTPYKKMEGFEFYPQKGKSLGDRMFNAFESALRKYSYAVLIGSDCPSLLIADLESAMKLLDSGKDLVLGPAVDGGYYLIGLRKNNVQLFSDIEWGKEHVFSETYSRAKKINLEVGLLEKRSDIDHVSDLHAYYRIKAESTS